MTSRSAVTEKRPGEPGFDEQTARRIGALASQPRKPVKRAPAAKVAAMGKMAAAKKPK